MALPEEVHEFLKMTHTSSAFLKPPISLIAHHICSQLTSIVLIYLQGKQEKIIFEHLVYVFREQLRDAGKQIVKMKEECLQGIGLKELDEKRHMKLGWEDSYRCLIEEELEFPLDTISSHNL